jgi:hypothetical protein
MESTSGSAETRYQGLYHPTGADAGRRRVNLAAGRPGAADQAELNSRLHRQARVDS